MPIRVTAPDGSVVNFPDGTSPETIDSVMRQQFPPQAAATPQEAAPPKDDASWLGVIADALYPYGVVATAGAAAGAPLGGVGAVPGAAGGVVTLGATDLLTTLYNLGATPFGAERIPTGSEMIRRGTRELGLSEAPTTSAQRVVHQTLESAAGAGGGAAALSQQAARMAPGAGRDLLRFLGQQPGVQTGAGAGAGLASSVGAELGATPAQQFLLGLGGGAVGGRMAAPRQNVPTLTRDQVRDEATMAYQAADDARVSYTPSSVKNFADRMQRRLLDAEDLVYVPELHPNMRAVVNRLRGLTSSRQPVTFGELEQFRRIANAARNASTSADERRLANEVIDSLDDFVANPPSNAVFTGQGQEAAEAVSAARNAWRRSAQSAEIEHLINRALRAEADPAPALRSQFRTVLNNPNRLRRFDPEIQTAMRDFVEGRRVSRALETLGELTPRTGVRGILAAGMYLGGTQLAPEVAIPLAGSALSARVAANRAATRGAREIEQQALRGAPRPPRVQTIVPSTVATGMSLLTGRTTPEEWTMARPNPLLPR